jgi:Fervidolysin N-terminal prodomain
MAARILVTLKDEADWPAVAQALEKAGATELTPPRPELPGVAVAVVPDDQVEKAVERFQAIDKVAVAEPDALRWSME